MMYLLMMLMLVLIVKTLIVNKMLVMILELHVDAPIDVDMWVDYYCYGIVCIDRQHNFDYVDENSRQGWRSCREYFLILLELHMLIFIILGIFFRQQT